MTVIMELLSTMGKVKKLQYDSGLDKEARFCQEFMALKAQYNFSARDVLRLLRPAASVAAPTLTEDLFKLLLSEEKLELAEESITKPMRRYRNPHTGEIVETRGSNHSRLKEWKKEYGADVLPSWREL